MSRRFLTALVLVALGLCACSTRGQYVVDIYPTDDGMRRVVSYGFGVSVPDELVPPPEDLPEPDPELPALPDSEVVGEQPMPPEDVVTQLTRAYGEPGEDGKWERTFGLRSPAALGGAGAMDRRRSPLGSVVLYNERFGGTDDLLVVEAARRKAVDILARLIRGWVMSEVSRDPRSRKLDRFLARDLRRDLGVLSLMLAEALRTASHEDDLELGTLLARLQLYLFEHGYVDRPSVLDHPDSRIIQHVVRTVLRREMGIPEGAPDPRSFQFLADDETTNRSLDRYLRGTEEFRRFRESMIARGKTDPASTEEEGAAVSLLLYVMAHSLGADLDFSTPMITVRLRCPVEPIDTNAKYDAETGIAERAVPLLSAKWPTSYVFAKWAEPARDRQERLFGRVVLDGEALAEFVGKWSHLSAAERAEWVTFARSLVPGEPLERVLERFEEHSNKTESDAVERLMWTVEMALGTLLNPPQPITDTSRD